MTGWRLNDWLFTMKDKNGNILQSISDYFISEGTQKAWGCCWTVLWRWLQSWHEQGSSIWRSALRFPLPDTYRWLNQEAVGEEIRGFWDARRKVQVESQHAVWRGVTCWHSRCRDVSGSHCVHQSSYCWLSTGLCPAQMDAVFRLEKSLGSGTNTFSFSFGHHLLLSPFLPTGFSWLSKSCPPWQNDLDTPQAVQQW